MRDTMARPARPFGAHLTTCLPAGPRGRSRKMILQLAYGIAGISAVFTLAPWNAEVFANGETRTLSFAHTHRQDSLTVTFRRNGQYDEQALNQLNWFLRDWRNDKPTRMDPRLFDILWEVYQEAGSRQPIQIISSFRSPETNSALRRRSSGVAENSQHMLGKAMDIRLPDVSTERLREIAMRMQYGGVGYYSSSDFVHVDTGNVRAWPRMSQQQLARLFPDGKTAHLPANGKPLPGYEQARVEIASRNAALAQQASVGGGSIGTMLANVFSRKTPAEQPAPAPAPESIQVASAATPDVVVKTMSQPVPLPPQRPQAPQVQTASIEPPLPPARMALAPAGSVKATASFEPILGFNVKAAVRSLFEPQTALLDTGFSSGALKDLSSTRFSGPAIRPVPRLEPQQTPSRMVARAG